MIACVECGAQHYPGALFCDACGAAVHPAAQALVEAVTPHPRRGAEARKKAADEAGAPHPQVELPPPLPAEPPKAPPLRVVIPHQETELTLQSKLIQVGRADPESGFSPELDLTPYDGFEHGVSRRHAAIQWVEGSYVILDQHSVNGTWLDGIRLMAGYAYQIPPGAEIRFGELVVQISIAD
jgi:pSer/pThr/pTyr-binding forkhead associated (FHA) protein